MIRKMYERNGIETIVDNDGILWLNEKYIEELDHKNLQEIPIKYNSDHRKHRYELVQDPKKQASRIFTGEKLAVTVIMCCSTKLAHKFRTRLAFKQYDVNLTKEQSVLTKSKSSFEGENIKKQYVWSYRTNLYKLAIGIDENGHSDRNGDYKIKRQNAIEQELGCKFIRIDPGKECFDIFRAINEIFRHIKQSNKKNFSKQNFRKIITIIV